LVWFAVLATGGRLVILAIKDVHHALMAALMVWMVVMPMPAQSDRSAPGTGGQAGMGHRNGPAPAAVTLAAYCLVATVLWIIEAGTTTGTAASTAAGYRTTWASPARCGRSRRDEPRGRRADSGDVITTETEFKEQPWIYPRS
jgi:hypothetical protein